MKTAQEHRAKAAQHETDRAESWERSDTDGFLSQWASGLNAQLERRKADLVDAGKMAVFTGLFEGDRRVKARMITTKYGVAWLLHEDEAELIERRGKKFLPTGKKSRVLRNLGLAERAELAPAWAKMDGRGYGLSGTAWVATFRTGDKWGQDATEVKEDA